MITNIEKHWDDPCEKCGVRADFRLTRTNDDLKDKVSAEGYAYYTGGSRYVFYCEEHLPEEAKHLWKEASK